MHRFIASAPRGLTDLLAAELRDCGAREVRDRGSHVAFEGELTVAYRACLWSRTASRVLLEIASAPVADADELYAFARGIDWREHLVPGATLACAFSGTHPTITHTRFGALKLKDAICDQLRDVRGERPDVETERPSVRVHAHADTPAQARQGRITLAIDLAGEGLHRRGYRAAAGAAPLRENVAAGMLLRAGWPAMARDAAELLDPLCGAGTIVIEAALIAANRAPQLTRRWFGFLGWHGHDAASWASLRTEAEDAALAGEGTRAEEWRGSLMRGSDRDGAAVSTALENARRAGVGGLVGFEVRELEDVRPVRSAGGLLCTNPPYGERLGDEAAARDTHRALGQVLRSRFPGWQAAVLTGDPKLGLEIGLRAHRTHVLWNGAIECRLLRMSADAGQPLTARRRGGVYIDDPSVAQQPGARMFANRLRKNLHRLARLAAQQGVSCYRLYDADMPEYSFAIDLYVGSGRDAGQRWLFVQEYAAPATVDEQAARRRREEALAVLPEVTQVPFESIHLRTRRRQKGADQYDKLDRRADMHQVEEGGLQFQVNFTDYLDTGLFLDHRLTRARLAAQVRATAAGRRRVLNLFCYTGSVTVYAAAAGALTTSVDLSATYLQWARRNLDLNGCERASHELLQADCMQWLEEAPAAPFDLVFLDPPTFSNSARMQGVLDVQRDHPQLVAACMRRLAAGGLLLFSTNAQRFRLAPELAERYRVEDVSEATLPFDFARNPRIHRCYEIRPA